MDGGRLRSKQGRKEKESHHDDKARLPSSGQRDRSRTEKVIQPLNIIEAIEVMKILAPIAQDIAEADNAAKMMVIIYEYFEKTDPTQTLQLASLFFHESLETLVEVLGDKSSEEFFYMMVEAFAANSLADLVESIFVLGFAEKRVSDGG